jgi:hypothetical protein
MMGHFGSIMAHGRELRIYRRLLICSRLGKMSELNWRKIVDKRKIELWIRLGIDQASKTVARVAAAFMPVFLSSDFPGWNNV